METVYTWYMFKNLSSIKEDNKLLFTDPEWF